MEFSLGVAKVGVLNTYLDLPNFNVSSNDTTVCSSNYYFITMMTKHRICLLAGSLTFEFGLII